MEKKETININQEVASTIVSIGLVDTYRHWFILNRIKSESGLVKLSDIGKALRITTLSGVHKALKKGKAIFWEYDNKQRSPSPKIAVRSEPFLNKIIRIRYQSKEKELLVNRVRQEISTVPVECLKSKKDFTSMIIGILAESENRGLINKRKCIQEIKNRGKVIEKDIVRSFNETESKYLIPKTTLQIANQSGFGARKTSEVLSKYNFKNKKRVFKNTGLSFNTKHDAVSFLKSNLGDKLNEVVEGKNPMYRASFKKGLYRWVIEEFLGTVYYWKYSLSRSNSKPYNINPLKRVAGLTQKASSTKIKTKGLTECQLRVLERLEQLEPRQLEYYKCSLF